MIVGGCFPVIRTYYGEGITSAAAQAWQRKRQEEAGGTMQDAGFAHMPKKARLRLHHLPPACPFRASFQFYHVLGWIVGCFLPWGFHSGRVLVYICTCA